MSFKKQIEALRKQREAKMEAAMELHKAAETESRTFSAEEQTKFDELTKACEALDAQIVATERLERLGAKSAVAVGGEGAGEGEGEGGQTDPPKGVSIKSPGSIQVVRNLPKGTVFTRYAMALAASKGNLMQAAEVSKSLWGETTPEVARILKAAVAAGTTTDATWAAPLVDYRVASDEFVELLRPETILGKLEGKLRRVPFNIRIPRQTAGAAVGWVGEAAPKPVGKLAFDTITMPETKIAGIVVITQELARFSSPSAEALVRADMIEAIAGFSDAAFMNPALAAVAGTNPASITNGAEQVKSTGNTLAQIEADLMAAMLWFTTRNIPLSSAVWIMNPATKMALAWKRTAQDVPAFPGVDQGVLKGIPIVESNSVAQYDFDAAGVENELHFYIALVSAPNVLLADDGQVLLDSSSEASISMTDDGAGTTLTSLWQRNMIGLRAERFIHWTNRRAEAVYVITDVAY